MKGLRDYNIVGIGDIVMDEREAIQFEMQDLREQSRLDFEMYFELRKQKSQRYNELLNRLRELDDRDLYRPIQEPQNPIKSLDKLIPRHELVTVQEMKLDRVREPKGNVLADYDEIIKVVEEFLKDKNPMAVKYIKPYVENHFGVKWTNFNNVMKRVMESSNHVSVDKTYKSFLYYYKE